MIHSYCQGDCGTDDPRNILYVPVGINKIKEGYDDIPVSLVEQGKAKSFKCKPEYKGKSVVPSRITITKGELLYGKY